ncbi:DUF1905 domain-containing protein [Flagellimonas flava]|uniref:Bacteriocin-protection, YdeI or OmpD-Associated n=1 Tax=Flagellimonas flava TaxID=570519 RepID=A0A1M5I599_9FLAO|nr:YdeI/OmpD-associated family protein [Allomuricauda flava]SHG23516.1 Bacteriocin-protection, YdeI or OmpD-Associated [Allomuricauda flava]
MVSQNKDGPIVHEEYLLQKTPGKGGWTYASLPSVVPNKKNPFGWVQVRGTIDDYSLKKYKLMPMGNGKLFLPVRAEIRKKINKHHGDYVQIVLFLDDSPLEIPTEILECFAYEPKELLQTFTSFREWEQKAYLDWIYAAKRETTKADRIAKMMHRLSKKLTFHQKEEQA